MVNPPQPDCVVDAGAATTRETAPARRATSVARSKRTVTRTATATGPGKPPAPQAGPGQGAFASESELGSGSVADGYSVPAAGSARAADQPSRMYLRSADAGMGCA